MSVSILYLPDSLLAKFAVDVKAYTVDDDDLCCLKLKIDFMKGRSLYDWL